MIIKYFGPQGEMVEKSLATFPVINMTREEIKSKSGMAGGPEVAKLEIEGAVFWLSVTVNGQGRPVAMLSTEPSKDKAVRKKVTGTCKK